MGLRPAPARQLVYWRPSPLAGHPGAQESLRVDLGHMVSLVRGAVLGFGVAYPSTFLLAGALRPPSQGSWWLGQILAFLALMCLVNGAVPGEQPAHGLTSG